MSLMEGGGRGKGSNEERDKTLTTKRSAVQVQVFPPTILIATCSFVS